MSDKAKRDVDSHLSGNLEGLIPNETVNSELGLPMELDERRLVLGVDEDEGVDTETLHHSQGTRDGSVRKLPHLHVLRLRRESKPVPRVVVSGLIEKLRARGKEERRVKGKKK